jgi:hypothetical protein
MRPHVALGVIGVALALAAGVHSISAQSSSECMVAAHRKHGEMPPRPRPPRFSKQVPYAAARQRLVDSGWQPTASSNADKCEDGDGRCQGRCEMESCAGTAEANCVFLWQKGDVTIAVSTIEDPPIVAGVGCRSGCKQKGKIKMVR